MFKKIVALATTLLLAAGLAITAVVLPATATNGYPTGSSANQEQNWQLLSGETCTKIEPVNTVPYILAAPPTGRTYSKVVVKTGSVESVGDPNAVYTTGLTVGAGFSFPNKDSISHVILCTIPTPVADSVDCSAAIVNIGSALNGSNYINMTLIQGGTTFQMNAEINPVQAQDAAVDGPTHLYVLIHAPGGDLKYPLTVLERDSGVFSYHYSTYLSGQWTVDWVQYDGHNEHFTGELTCGTDPVVQDASASVTITPASCVSAETLVLNTPTNATWGAPTISTGPGDYSVTATAALKHAFSGGGTTQVFHGTLGGILPSTGSCAPPCITKANVSYTYIPNSNSGVITVTDVGGSSHALCQGFWVTATSWKYTTNQMWPQIRDVVDKRDKIVVPGTYPYAAAVSCGQGDIYANFGYQPDPSLHLVGPNQPGPGETFTETFLHNMGFQTSTPGHTWTNDTPGCNEVPVVTPTAKVSSECGAYGSIVVPADTDAIDYTLTGDGKTGHNVVTAVAKGSNVLTGYPAGGWTFELGNYAACQTQCPATTPTVTSTNLDQSLWDFATESRSGGHREYVTGGLHIWTDNSTSVDKSAGYYPTNFLLADAGNPSLTYVDTNTPQQAAPGIQMTLYVGGVWKGNLVKEPLFDKWWINKSIAGLPAGPNPSYQLAYGTINEILFAYAQNGVTSDKLTVQAVGFSLGAGAKGDGTITRLTVGCSNYVFNKQVVDPHVTIELGACYPSGFSEAHPEGTFSSKNVYFWFDNTGSTVPVTFTVPSANPAITQVVQPGEKVKVGTTPMVNAGGSYDVIINGDTANPIHTVIEPFANCFTGGTPGDPKLTPEQCVSGVVTNGSIWVDFQPGLVYTITRDSDSKVFVPDANGFASVPAGDYTVKVVAAPGFVVAGLASWPQKVTVAAPAHCEKLSVPVVPTAAITCKADGSYTLPTVTGVSWLVNGALTAPGTHPVATATTVHFEAVAADTYGFPDGATTSWDHQFVAPTGCELTTHPLVTPANVTWVNPTCSTDGSYTIPATTGVLWFIGATPVNPGKYVVTAATTRTITAKPDAPAYGFDTGVTTSWNVVIAAPPSANDPACNLQTHPLVTPAAVTAKQPTCAVDGSYTIPTTTGVEYSIGGRVVSAGTYPVTGVKSVTVTAAAIAPNYGLEEGAQTSWPLIFLAAPTDCLATLAFTGVTGTLGLGLALGFVMLGVAGIVVRRRYNTEK